MGTYNIPRKTKGEGRILYIFSTKALIFSCIGAAIGFPFYYILKMINFNMAGWIIMGILALIGFCIATFKVPDSKNFDVTRKLGGTNIDEAIKRYIKFRQKKNRIYIVYNKEEKVNDK